MAMKGQKYARHPECVSCVNFDPTRMSATCIPCGAGEFFEERTDHHDFSESKLIRNMAKMKETDE